MADESSPSAATDRAEFAAVVLRESARLSSMLRTVLDLSQVEAGKVEFRTAAVDLRAAVLASYERLRPEFRAAGAKLKLHVEEDAPTGMADPDWLGRVTDALLSNAAKFGGGADVHVTIRRDGADALVEVVDSGPGVPEAVRGTIFEKFKQLGDVLTEKPPGLGLGLPMARILVQRMGGSMRHAAGARGGSVFSFRLPAGAAAPRSAVSNA